MRRAARVRLWEPSGRAAATASVATVVAAGLALRLVVARGRGFFWDVDLFRGWIGLLQRVGTSGFYAEVGEIDYPPGYLYVLWYLGRVYQALGHGIPGDVGIRLPAIAFDLGLALLGGAFAARIADPSGLDARARRAATIVGVALVALNPAFLLDSAAFGQFEALAAVLALAAAWYLGSGRAHDELAAGALLAVAVITKPHVALFALPVAVVLAHRHLRVARDPAQVLRLAGIGAVSAGFLLLALAPFRMDTRGLTSLLSLAAARHHDVTSFSMNAWALAGWWRPERTVAVLGMPAGVVALVAFLAGAAAVAVLVWRALAAGRSELEVVCLGGSALSGWGWAVLTRMHERYALYALAFAVPVAATQSRVRRWFFAASAFVTLNLLYTYWFFNTWDKRPVARIGLLEATLFRMPAVRVLSVVGTLLFAAPVVLLARLRGMPKPIERASTAPDATEVAAGRGPALPGWIGSFGATAARTLRDPVVRRVTVLALALRAGLQIVGMESVARSGGGRAMALDMWSRWDAPHYLRVAEVGYKPSGEDGLFIVFFPFYPLAVRAASVVFRDLVLSGLVVSLVASVVAGVLLYRLVRLDADRHEAWRAVVLLFTFPTAYFLAAPYTEALFLVGVLGAVHAARTARWPWAGAAGALATGTRVAGVGLLPPLVVEALGAPGAWRERVRRLVWLPLAGVGLGVYLAINWAVRGDPLAFLDVQRGHWFQRPVPPWVPIVEAFHAVGRAGLRTDEIIIYWGRLSAAVFAATLLLIGARRLRVADQLYAWSGLVLLLGASWLLSLPRYLLGLYPLFVVEARLTRRRAVYWSAVTAGLAGQAWFFWRYARGWWTF